MSGKVEFIGNAEKELRVTMKNVIQERSVEIQRDPPAGTILRIPFEGMFAYCCVVNSVELWLYDFLTKEPACGVDFFPWQRWLFGVSFTNLPVTFAPCGRLVIPKEISQANQYFPKFYYVLDPEEVGHLGFKYPYAANERNGYRSLSPEEIQKERRFRHQWLDYSNYVEVISEWRHKIEVREVPEAFLDKKALSGEPVLAKALPSEEVELVIVFQDADTITDEPEEVFVEPLEEAVADAECGEVVASGTTPGVFEINVDTCRSDLRRCLTVIRRVLKKAGAPASTEIVQLGETEIVHPLEAPPKVTKKKVARKKRKRGDKER